jgi:uncharacterized integral membrane protein
MFRKIITAIIVVPLAVILIAFAVANRQTVTVSLDPFSSVNPAYAASLPQFALIFVVLIFGVLVGGAAAWIRQSKWRRIARQRDAEVRVLHQELDALRQRTASPPLAARPDADPLPVIPPPMA